MQPFQTASLIENATPLDRLVDPVRRGVRKIFGAGPVRDALHGVWLGHPVHPTLVQVSLGAFMSATLLDAVPGNERASRALIGAGLASVPPTAVTGWTDWADMHPQQQRVGLVHAVCNLAGVACYGASLASRLQGREERGKALGVVGLSLLGVGGYLGGHLSFRQAAGANHAEDVPHVIAAGWHDLCAVDDLGPYRDPQLQLLRGPSGVVPLVVVRDDERIDVLSAQCSHLGGPLHEGELDSAGTCITCPWHGSRFSLADGSVRGGPATAPVHAFDVRVEGGRVMVRLPGAARPV